ncbi:MAG TPA: hypothetical protein VIF83_11645 [Gemmatimonadaceae bacterium]
MIRRFLLRVGALAAAVALSGILISAYDDHTADNNYLAAVLEKDRLIRRTPSPKVILVGGSNLAFGVDSKQLQDSLGLHVINMGLYAKLGLRYMLAQVKPYVQKGDVVIVSPEYDQFYGNYADGDQTLNTALLYTPSDRLRDFIKSYSVIDVVLRPRVENARRSFLMAAADAFGVKNRYFPPDTNPVYNRRSFNEYGDMVAHLTREGKNPDSIYVGPIGTKKELNLHTVDLLEDIARHSRARGAHAYFMYPSYIDRAYSLNSAAIDSLARVITRRVRMTIVGSPRDFVYPSSWFFDTRYHLTAAGRQHRTREMIRLLSDIRRRDHW